jgi:hypothetical protein
MINAKHYTFPLLFGFIERNIFTVFFYCMAKKAAKREVKGGGRLKEMSEIWAQS